MPVQVWAPSAKFVVCGSNMKFNTQNDQWKVYMQFYLHIFVLVYVMCNKIKIMGKITKTMQFTV